MDRKSVVGKVESRSGPFKTIERRNLDRIEPQLAPACVQTAPQTLRVSTTKALRAARGPKNIKQQETRCLGLFDTRQDRRRHDAKSPPNDGVFCPPPSHTRRTNAFLGSKSACVRGAAVLSMPSLPAARRLRTEIGRRRQCHVQHSSSEKREGGEFHHAAVVRFGLILPPLPTRLHDPGVRLAGTGKLARCVGHSNHLLPAKEEAGAAALVWYPTSILARLPTTPTDVCVASVVGEWGTVYVGNGRGGPDMMGVVWFSVQSGGTAAAMAPCWQPHAHVGRGTKKTGRAHKGGNG